MRDGQTVHPHSSAGASMVIRQIMFDTAKYMHSFLFVMSHHVLFIITMCYYQSGASCKWDELNCHLNVGLVLGQVLCGASCL